MGIPWRIVVGDKNLAGDTPKVEVKRRSEKDPTLVELTGAAVEIAAGVRAELKEQA
jgi:prolyl-tRNA synthetase